MKQVIIARKDLNMSPGKLAAQVSHASMAYFTNKLRRNAYRRLAPNYECFRTADGNSRQWYRHPDLDKWCKEAYDLGKNYFYCEKVFNKNLLGYELKLVDKNQVKYEYVTTVTFDTDVFEEWINSSFTKVICEAKNRNQLLKAVAIANELGLKENEDYFLIKDNCYTELEPEEFENSIGRTLTCIGFRPLPNEISQMISKKYQLFH